MATTSAPVLMDPERVFPKLPRFTAISVDYYIFPNPRDDEEWFAKHQQKNANKDPGQNICEYFLSVRDPATALFRLADRRQPELNQEAIEAPGARTTTVFTDRGLGAMFVHRGTFLNLLHAPCLQDPPICLRTLLGDIWRYDSLIDSIERDPQRFAILEAERLNLKDASRTKDVPPFQLRDEFHWLQAFHRSARESIQLLIATYRFGVDNLSNADKTTELMRSAYCTIPAMTRLLVLLLSSENKFEGRYAAGHVCDTLMPKRLRCVNWRNSSANGMHWAYRETIERTRRLEEGLAKYSMAMRQLYAYRYIAEWCPGRPWKKLYTVVDKKNGSDAIKEFMEFTSTTTLARYMFGVHPLFEGDLDPEDICAICQEIYGVGELLMELRNCPHRFHAHCIISHFDQHHRYDNLCPVCRTSAGRIQDFWPYLQTSDVDVCYGRDSGASVEAGLRDHQIRHYQRRGFDVADWPAKIQEYFWERERLAWLRGATVEQRMALFPHVVDDDQASASDDCEWDEQSEAGDEDAEGEDDDDEMEDDEGEYDEMEEAELISLWQL
ncbi:hypothetical protein EDD36DRAFT_421586 [Exophiala viscosa]|uniref:RING-type domain-containing protein n=1 Tax=Exophiala viscosa TaxID=2486360 RepID=A0AAN6IB39_9EURO|nr:hypothetical protein EDD36DRAFT_421586 [Exophiala viscosa]